ncbi:MAG: peroxide stress protein YaaA [Burkholderiales bacterium]
MLFLLSPAKTLDYDTPARVRGVTTPQFVSQSAELINLLKSKSVADIAALMDLSEPLAALNVGRYGVWSPRFTAKNSKPAVLAFNGDVYEGLDASSLGEADLEWAQEHLLILSGLYGVLRPLDKMQPYRLEMGTALTNARGGSLYAYWGDTLAQHINERMKSDPSPVIVNLASQEYFKAIRPTPNSRWLKPRVVECVFEDWKAGQYKIISFFAKRARGLMARHAITQRVQTPQGLQGFVAEGYSFDAAASEPHRLVFRRKL